MKNGLATKIYRKKTVQKIENKINLLGQSCKINVASFLNVRLLLTILIFIFVFALFKFGYFLAPVFALVFYFSFEYFVLDYQAAKRGKRLEKEALFFFEVLVLTLEGGRSLKHALSLTVENVSSELSSEFQQMLAEVRLGKSLKEGLEDMKKRIPSDSINNAILNMIESNTFGNSIIDSMYNQIEYLREKQMLNVKAEIAKLPTKVSIISVIFFVPIMMLIILAPVIIQYISK